jgi:hypothetical protein
MYAYVLFKRRRKKQTEISDLNNLFFYTKQKDIGAYIYTKEKKKKRENRRTILVYL